MKAYKENLIT